MPPPRVTCSLDTEYEISASYSFSSTWYTSYYLKNTCIRSTTHRRAISCYLFECHVLLIRNTKIQPDIPVSKFLGLPLYQEHRPTAGDVVLAPRVSCSPGRKYGNSAIYFCSFVRYSCPKTFYFNCRLINLYFSIFTLLFQPLNYYLFFAFSIVTFPIYFSIHP